MMTPCALIVSYTKTDAKDLVKGILQKETLPDSSSCYGANAQSFPWSIETKYYTADVHLCTVSENVIDSKDMLENTQALVVLFDNNKDMGLNNVNRLMSILGGYEPQVRLLVCDNCSNDESVISRHAILEWCLKNGFELVELRPDETSDSEDDFAETTGIKRVIEALHAHTWSNMIMKDKTTLYSPKLEQVLRLESLPDNANLPNPAEHLEDEMKNLSCKEGEVSVAAPEEVAKLFGSDDASGDQSFESLFDKFQVMKDKAKDLPFSERKLYAEQVALAFWRAMGGDEEEISGLQDSGE